MTLTLRHKILISIGAVILLGLTVYLTRDLWLPANIDYSNKHVSFEYPREYKAMEYSRGAVIVGTEKDKEFTPLVEVIRYENERDVALPPTFDAYVGLQAQALCGSDASAESLTCSDVVSVPYTSAQGLVGQELSLTLTRENLTSGTTSTSTFGPLYVFNTTRPPKDRTDTLRYRAIFVYPAFASVAAASTSPALLTKIIDSLLLLDDLSTITTSK